MALGCGSSILRAREGRRQQFTVAFTFVLKFFNANNPFLDKSWREKKYQAEG